MDRRILGSLLVVIAVSGCKHEPLTPAGPPIIRIEITPKSPVVGIGSSVQLSVVMYGYKPEGGFVWRSNDESIARVSNSGVVTGVRAGDVDILALPASDTTLIGVVHVAIR